MYVFLFSSFIRRGICDENSDKVSNSLDESLTLDLGKLIASVVWDTI